MKIYNTLTRQKQEFVPINKGEVKMYSCGPTVYDYFHIGNARPFIVFDTMRRYLEYQGYKVTFVQNFTDIDDKMIKRANEEGITVKELGERFIAEYFKDAQAIGIHKATIHPKATENIDAIINVVKKLVDNGYAYDVDGNVYFSTKKFNEYGKLSKQPLEDLEAGARIDVNEHKKDVMDFALWKKQKEGEPAWESPWGMGRPGWHIECSVMSKHHLGDTFDIHAGGEDLIFPHHENEIAQSEAANGCTFARYWLHNGFITVDNEKMSKSLGNFFTVRDIAKHFPYEVIRFFILNGHYRSPINFSDELMKACQNGLERIKNARKELNFYIKNVADTKMTAEEAAKEAELNGYKEQFEAAMDDDFNTADAVSAIYELVRFSNTEIKAGASKEFAEKIQDMLDHLCGVLGIAEVAEEEVSDEDVAKIEALISERTEAKKAKDFAKADAIRDELAAMGITIKDTRQGVQWFRG